MTIDIANQAPKNGVQTIKTGVPELVHKQRLTRGKYLAFSLFEIGKNSDPDQLKQTLYMFYSTHNKYSLKLLV